MEIRREQIQKDWSAISRVFKRIKMTKNVLMGLEEGCYIETDIYRFYKDENNQLQEEPILGEYVSIMAERKEQWRRIVMLSANNRTFRVYQKKA